MAVFQRPAQFAPCRRMQGDNNVSIILRESSSVPSCPILSWRSSKRHRSRLLPFSFLRPSSSKARYFCPDMSSPGPPLARFVSSLLSPRMFCVSLGPGRPYVKRRERKSVRSGCVQNVWTCCRSCSASRKGPGNPLESSLESSGSNTAEQPVIPPSNPCTV
ncbi:unnamed protein product [Ectocarpus sp. 12 AP-2014]